MKKIYNSPLLKRRETLSAITALKKVNPVSNKAPVKPS